jgi:hypothetical protein
MARARNIKPSFFTNEELVELSFGTRLLFIGLWTLADRDGRLDDRPKKIKMGLFPADDFNVDLALNELQERGFLERYEIENNKYIQILTFQKHQNPHKDEKASTIPAPCKHHASTVQNGLIPDSLIPDSLIPDSLIPDSLIPECGIMNVESAAIAAPPPRQKTITKKTRPIDPLAVNWHQILQEKGVRSQTAADFLTVRKSKKAAMTQTALDRIVTEAGKAGVTLETALATAAAKGWQGFEAQWYANLHSSGQQGAPPQQRGYVSKQAQLEANSDAVVAAFHARLDREAQEQSNTVEMA